MNPSRPTSRRRFLRIVGLAALTSSAGRALPAAGVRPWTWQGVVLGADASIQIHGLPESTSRRLTRSCFKELRRCERIFSLYEPESAVCRLNRAGRLPDPPPELVDILKEARAYGERTGGAFDVSVQPLWTFLRDHHAREPGAEPSPQGLREVLDKVDYRAIRISTRLAEFARPGMAITLNGIAQGWITDRVTDYLRREGVSSTLVNIGEYRALGGHPEQRPWQLGVSGSAGPDAPLDILPLENAALAVSGGHGHPFAEHALAHHLVDPRTGRCRPAGRTVAVVAPTATEADALSTACAVVDDRDARRFATRSSVRLQIYS